MRPVEQTKNAVGFRLSEAAARWAIVWASCNPSEPVQALALPELAMMPWKGPAVREVLLAEQHGRGLDGVLGEGAGGRAGAQGEKQREIEALEIVLLADIAGDRRRVEAGHIGDAGAIQGDSQLGH